MANSLQLLWLQLQRHGFIEHGHWVTDDNMIIDGMILQCSIRDFPNPQNSCRNWACANSAYQALFFSRPHKSLGTRLNTPLTLHCWHASSHTHTRSWEHRRKWRGTWCSTSGRDQELLPEFPLNLRQQSGGECVQGEDQVDVHWEDWSTWWTYTHNHIIKSWFSVPLFIAHTILSTSWKMLHQISCIGGPVHLMHTLMPDLLYCS